MASTTRPGQYTQISVNRSRATADSVAVITLQRPRALNAITKRMLTELVTALSRCVPLLLPIVSLVVLPPLVLPSIVPVYACGRASAIVWRGVYGRHTNLCGCFQACGGESAGGDPDRRRAGILSGGRPH